jgi:DNA polymerase-3 subunit beta
MFHAVLRQKNLLKELNALSGVTSRKKGVGNDILFEINAELRQLTLSGTDLDVSIKTTCPLDSFDTVDGAILLPARKTSDIISLLDDGGITLDELENNWIKVTQGKQEYKFPGLDPKDFPSVKWPEEYDSVMQSRILLGQLERVLFAIPDKHSIDILRGALLVMKNDILQMQAADGYVMPVVASSVKTAIKPNENGDPTPVVIEVVIPKNAIQDLLKLMGDDDIAKGVTYIHQEDNRVFFKLGDREITATLMSGKYPDFQRSFPKKDQLAGTFSVEREQIVKAIKRANTLSDKKDRTVKLSIANGELTASSKSADGNAKSPIKVESNGLEFKTHFNPEFLLRTLSSITTPKVAFDLTENATIIRPVEDGEFSTMCLTLPKLVNDEE